MHIFCLRREPNLCSYTPIRAVFRHVQDAGVQYVQSGSILCRRAFAWSHWASRPYSCCTLTLIVQGKNTIWPHILTLCFFVETIFLVPKLQFRNDSVIKQLGVACSVQEHYRQGEWYNRVGPSIEFVTVEWKSIVERCQPSEYSSSPRQGVR